MHRSLRLAILSTVLLASRAAADQPLIGQTAKVFDFGVSRVLPDPIRPRVYASVPSTNSVVVIDTATLTIATSIFVGSGPVDLAISPDDNTLYIANGGSSAAAIGVIDLNTLKAKPALSLPVKPASVAAGLDGRLYVMEAGGFGNFLYQIDAATGAVQGKYASNSPQAPYATGFGSGRLRISPDDRTLFVCDGTLYKFDVSTAQAALLDSHAAGEDGAFVALSHNGQYVTVLGGSGNFGQYGTALYSTDKLSTQYGGFDGNKATDDFAYPGPLAFSNDDAFVYQLGSGNGSSDATVLRVFSTQTFLESQEILLNFGGTNGFSFDVTDVQVDSTGSYLFVGQTGAGLSGEQYLTVITTGTGYLKPAALLPLIACPYSLDFSCGIPCSYAVPTLNPAASFSANSLPPGLSIDAVTGVISGIPTAYSNYYVTITATNAAGTSSFPVNIGTYEADPNITSPTQVYAIAGQPLSFQLTADEPIARCSCDDLPAGLNLDTATGLITGTLAMFGHLDASIEVVDTRGRSSYSYLSFVTRSVLAAAPPADPFIDLAGTVLSPKVRLKGSNIKIVGTYSLANLGNSKAKKINIGAYLAASSSFEFPPAVADPAIQQLALSVTTVDDAGNLLSLPVLRNVSGEETPVKLPFKLKALGSDGASQSLTFSFKFPASNLTASASGQYRYLVLVADPQNTIPELVKTNNVSVIDLQSVQGK